MKYTMNIFMVVLIGGLVLSACGNQPTQTATATPLPAGAVIAEGHLKPLRAASLSFMARGVVQDVNVQLGVRLREGDVMLRLANADQAEAELVAAQQAYDLLLRNAGGDHAAAWTAYMNAQKVRETAQKKWDDINLNDIENRIEDRQKDVEDRQVDLDQARRDFDKYKNLNEDDPKYRDAEDDLDHAQSDYDEAVKDLEATMRERDVPRANLDSALAAEAEAKYQYELGINGPNADQLALAKARLAAAQDLLANYVISAPFDGTVMDINFAEGEEASPETWAIKIADTTAWYVETSDLTELEVVKVGEGQSATIAADALPDAPMTGRVESISRASTTQGGDILYQVRIKVDEIDPRALWGMTVEVTFVPGEE
jgi:multidrug efflux pump subunit AcrA (membrane-fusion protein)